MTPITLAYPGPWYSAAPTGNAVPHYVPSPAAINRYNDGSGTLALRYFAADPVTALMEARALVQSGTTGFVRAGHIRRWTVYCYQIASAQSMRVVDLGDPAERGSANTTVQELTGDWVAYGFLRTSTGATAGPVVRLSQRAPAPTQQLAQVLHQSPGLVGFLAPSARRPRLSNLVLFHHRVPAGTITVTGRGTVVLP